MKKKGSAFRIPKSVKRSQYKGPKNSIVTKRYGWFSKKKQFCVLKNLEDCSKELTVHHITPQSEGGSDRRENQAAQRYVHRDGGSVLRSQQHRVALCSQSVPTQGLFEA